jgi:hypothetical protein
MHKRLVWSRILCIVGAGTIIIAPAAYFLFEWWASTSATDLTFTVIVLFSTIMVLPLFGSGLVTLGGFLGKSRYRKFLYATFLLAICALITTIGLFIAGRDITGVWWLQSILLAYLIGAIMSCVGAVLAIIESFRRPTIPQGNADVT